MDSIQLLFGLWMHFWESTILPAIELKLYSFVWLSITFCYVYLFCPFPLTSCLTRRGINPLILWIFALCQTFLILNRQNLNSVKIVSAKISLITHSDAPMLNFCHLGIMFIQHGDRSAAILVLVCLMRASNEEWQLYCCKSISTSWWCEVQQQQTTTTSRLFWSWF